jgi:NAD(P) transhydrogenase subunit alpha
MPITIGVLRETPRGERRVALVPGDVAALLDAKGVGAGAVLFERGCGLASGYPDSDYEARGAAAKAARADVLAAADVVLFVRPETGLAGPARAGQTFVGMGDALSKPQAQDEFAKGGASTIALELLPRITRAQAMDVLSSQATLAGYRAVLLAANRMPRIFPMLVTAAGTISAARAFVIGAGVAGLQAIATAKRLGAIVEAYDTRAAAAEQIESLGARFVTFELETKDAQDAGGYAKAQSEEFYAKQRTFMAAQAARSDLVITTALVPGRRAPVLLDEAGVRGMKPGSVIVDLAAPNGGNCACTRANEDVLVNGVHVLGPSNLASDVPVDASRMFSRNVVNFVSHLVKEGKLALDLEDEITKGSLVAHGGEVVHPVVRPLLAGA